jgi:hypothetical protein
VKLGPRTTVWKVVDIRAFIDGTYRPTNGDGPCSTEE